MPAKPRKKRQDCRCFDNAGSERVRNLDIAGHDGIHQPCDTKVGVASELERVAIAIVNTAENYVDSLQPMNSLEVDVAITDCEVGALHERETQVAREV